jgi:hypothetical protein
MKRVICMQPSASKVIMVHAKHTPKSLVVPDIQKIKKHEV